MRIRKLIYFIVVVSIILTSVIHVFAAESQSIASKADALTKIGIMKGSIEGQLRRSESATFLVRMLGKESIVDSYKNTNLKDVAPTAWYAPYVGYCTSEGIITGFPDGTFLPDENISEKSFLKMVLVYIGYTYGIDFDWSNVYKTAYEAGLVEESVYATKIADNNNYNRSEVVKVIYNALKTENKKANKKMIQMLIDESIVDRQLALSLGFLNDTIETSIESITALGTNTVSVKLNEQVKQLSERDIIIFERDNPVNRLEITSIVHNSKDIIITTSMQQADKEYSIGLDNIFDMENNKSNMLSGAFIGYRSSTSDFFKISKAEPVSSNIVNLYFTQPITDNSTIPSYYKILKGNEVVAEGTSKSITVKRISSVNNAVSIYLKELSFKEGEKYTIYVGSDFTSLYTVKLNDGKGDNITFTGKGNENGQLEVKAITPLSSKSIEVVFNKEIDPVFSQKFLNYTVIKPDNSTIAVNKAVMVESGDNAGRAVHLTLMSDLDKSTKYTMKFEYIPDIHRESALEGYLCNFNGLYADNTDLAVTFATAPNKGTVHVYFNRPLNPETATINVYYYIFGLNVNYLVSPTHVGYEEKNGYYIAKLYLPKDNMLYANGKYSVRVLSSMQDNKGLISSKDAEYTFLGSAVDVPGAMISEATIISNDTIRLTFNRDIAHVSPNTQISNYALMYTIDGMSLSKQPISVIPIDTSTFILKFDSLNYETKYELRYMALKDITESISGGTSSAGNKIGVTLGK